MAVSIRVRTSLKIRARRVLNVLAFGLAPVSLFLAVITPAAVQNVRSYGLEFRGNLWQPGKLILSGSSPYEPQRLDALAAVARSGREPRDLPALAQAVYPAPTHVLAAPFAFLPFEVAMALFAALSVAAVVGALWILGVRDWRCYGIAFLSVEVVQAIKLGGITPFLLLGLAALWRYRESVGRSAIAGAAMIVAKLFLWPMIFWLLATGRRATAWWSVAGAAAAAVSGWAVIGFRGLDGYPHLLSTLAFLEQRRGDSLAVLGAHLGLDPGLSRLVAAGVGLAVLAAMVAAGRAGHEYPAFVLALAAAFALTPIVWTQYFMLLFVPIAVMRPRLGLVWCAPLLLWLVPPDGPGTVPALVSESALVATVLWALAAGRAAGAAPGPRPAAA